MAWMEWTTERTELAEALWTQGLSARAIAKRLGGGLTRNAVIGRMHRLGHRRNANGLSQTFGKAASIALRKRRRPKATELSLNVGGIVIKGGPLPPEPPKPEKLLSLFAVTEIEEATGVRLCRFPFGDPKTPGFGFCGCPAAAGSSYCPGHHHLCMTPPVPRKRQTGGFRSYVKTRPVEMETVP